MPTLPWVTPNPAKPGTNAYVMASRFVVRSGKDVPRFFMKSLAVWGQVRKAPGALGASLEARLLAGEFYSLAAWESKDALYAFVGVEPHRSIMRSLHSTMRLSTFTFWEVPVEQLPISWPDAKRRIETQARADAAKSSPTHHPG